MPLVQDAYDALVLTFGTPVFHLSGLNNASAGGPSPATGAGSVVPNLASSGSTYNFTAQGAADAAGAPGPVPLGSPTLPTTSIAALSTPSAPTPAPPGLTDFLQCSATPVLMGHANWALSWWQNLDQWAPSGVINYCVYSERGSSGTAYNEVWINATGASLTPTTKSINDDSTSIVATLAGGFSAASLGVGRRWCHWIVIRQGGSFLWYFNGQRQRFLTGLASTSTQTSAVSPDMRIGASRVTTNANPSPGAFWRLTAWNALSTSDWLNADNSLGPTTSFPACKADLTARQLYEVGMPLGSGVERPFPRSMATVWKSNGVFNQRVPRGNPSDWIAQNNGVVSGTASGGTELTSPLATGTPITSLPVAATDVGWSVGTNLTLLDPGAQTHIQGSVTNQFTAASATSTSSIGGSQFVVASTVHPGDTTIAVQSQTPLYAFPVGTLVMPPATAAMVHDFMQSSTTNNAPTITYSTATMRLYPVFGAGTASPTPGSQLQTQRVRLIGGRYANPKADKAGLWNAMAAVPVPTTAVASGYSGSLSVPGSGAGGVKNDSTADQETAILRINADRTIECWEFIRFRRTLTKNSVSQPTFVKGSTQPAIGQDTVQPVAPGNVTGLNLPAGTYDYGIPAFNANGASQTELQKNSGNYITTDGTQAIAVVQPQGIIEDPAIVNPTIIHAGDGVQGYYVIRRRSDAGGDGFYHLIDTLTWDASTPAATGSAQFVGAVPGVGRVTTLRPPSDQASNRILYYDDGSQTPTTPYWGLAATPPTDDAQTTDLGCSGGSYVPDTRQSTGTFADVAGRTDWGVSGSGVMRVPGIITLLELLTHHIPHGLFANNPNNAGNPADFVYPASRTDGKGPFGNAEWEGMRWVLPRNQSTSQYTVPIRAIVRALQEYGQILADTGPSGFWLMEDISHTTYGRDLAHLALGVDKSSNSGVGISINNLSTSAGGLGQLLGGIPVHRMVLVSPTWQQTLANRGETQPISRGRREQ